MSARKPLLTAALLLIASPGHAIDWQPGGDTGPLFSLQNTVSIGAAWRVEDRDINLIGKASVAGNRDLCSADNCIGLSEGDTAPNQRFLAAPGGLSSNIDDGNLNYDRGDIAAATAKWSPRLSVDWGDYSLEASAIYFFDPVNRGFDETHPNRIITPGPGTGSFVRTPRSEQAERDVGEDFALRNLYLKTTFELPGNRLLDVKLGRQLLNWGVSAFGIATSINVVNPADLNNLVRPGAELFELYLPQNMLVLAGDLFESTTFEAFYQLEWLPFGFPAKGSLLSFFDAGNEVEPNETVVLPFGKTPEDPLLQGTPANSLLGLVSATSFSAARAPNREPSDRGQYGLAVYHFFDRSGIELGLFAANYHSRLPSVSVFATDASCTRREGNANHRDTTNLVQFLSDCGIPGVDTPGTDFDALPLDSARYFLDYAEDIRMFGASLIGDGFGAAWQMELSYRPNFPVQVDLEDLLFAAFQPAFPRNTLTIIPENPVTDVAGSLLTLLPALTLPGGPLDPADLGPATLAASQLAIPDFLTAYRGGTPGEIAPNSYIAGYERMPLWQASASFLRIWAAGQVLGADQFGLLFELDGIYLPDLPHTSVAQFEAPGTSTHASPGIAETGNGLLINPIQETGQFVTAFSWGYRAGVLLLYNNVMVSGLSLRPLIVMVHDIEGVAPGLAENHLEGRTIMLNNLEAKYGNFSFNLQYARFGGGGRQNTLKDRDLIALAVSYDF